MMAEILWLISWPVLILIMYKLSVKAINSFENKIIEQ